MEILFLLLGIAIGAVIIWFLKQSKQQERLRGQEFELKSKYEKEIVQLNDTAQEQGREFQRLLLQEKERRIRAEEKLKVIQENAEEREKHIIDTFKNMANKAMESNNEAFLRLANQSLEKYILKADASYEQKTQAVDNLLKPIHEAIEKQQAAVKELENKSSQTFGSLRNYLEALNKSHQELQKETGALVTALKSPKVRGRWGEIGLKRIVEFSGLSEYCDFNEQVNYNTEEGRLRPDMVVHLPGNKNIVVDSKVPLNAYLESLETSDETEQKLALQRHTKAVAGHMKDLGSKAYWSELGESVDFVVLYIEVESAFGAALSLDNSLVTEGIRNRVVFATPTTLITLLQTVAYSWKQHKATENSQEILKTSVELYERLATFADNFKKVGSNLNTMVKTYNSAIGSWDARVLPSIRKLENMSVSSEKKTVESIEQVESIPRELSE